MASLMSPPYFNVGAGLTPADGAKLFFYVAGSATPKSTYTTSGATVAHANPVVADSKGVFDAIYITGDYDWVLQDKNSVQRNSGSVSEFVTATSTESEYVLNRTTLSAATADTTMKAGYAVNLAERTAGNGGGGKWDVIAGTGTANGYNIVVHDTLSLSFVLRINHLVDVKQFGALGDGVTDDYLPINNAKIYAVSNSKILWFPQGHYMTSGTISHVTNTGIASPDTDPYRNGLVIRGVSQNAVTIEALIALGDNPIIDLDGNGDNKTLVSEGLVAQAYSRVSGIRLRGHTRNDFATYPNHHGIRIRALWNSVFSDLVITNLAGSGIEVNGTTVAGQDDVDTTIGCTFKNVFIRKTNIGFDCTKSRASLLSLINVTVRYADTIGINFSAINSSLINCFAVETGLLIPNITGIGLYIRSPATGAKIRTLTIDGGGFDANSFIDVNIEQVNGLSFTSGNFAPFFAATTSNKRCINIGTSTDIAQNININCPRMQAFTDTFSDGITAINVGGNAKSVRINNVSIDSQYATAPSVEIAVDVGANDITRDGYMISGTSNRPAFKTQFIVGADLPNITGDGTEVVASALASSTTVIYDQDSNLTTNKMEFVAPNDGLYKFRSYFELTGFSAHTSIESGYVVNIAGTTVRYQVQKSHLNTPTGNIGTGGTVTIKLDAGDTVTPIIKVSGGALVVDMVRTVNPSGSWFEGCVV